MNGRRNIKFILRVLILAVHKLSSYLYICFKSNECLNLIPSTKQPIIISSDWARMLWILAACGLVSPV